MTIRTFHNFIIPRSSRKDATPNIVSKSGKIAWNANSIGEYQFCHTLENAIEGINSVIKENVYIDVHNWCFVPHSFRLIVRDLFYLGLIPFQEVDFLPTAGFEFYVTLGRNGKGIQKSRMEMLETIELEIQEEKIVAQRNLAGDRINSGQPKTILNLPRL